MKTFSAYSALPTILLTAVTPVIWGTTYVATTEFLPEGRPLIAAVIRTLPAGLLLIALTGRARPRIAWGRLLLLSILNIGAFQALLFVAAYRLPGGIAAVIGALQPLMMLSLVWGVDKQRPRKIALGSAVGGVAGMGLLFASPGAQWDAIGILAAFAGTASMGLGAFLSRRWLNGMPLLDFTGWQLSLGGLLLLPLALLIEDPLPVLSMSNWLSYGYLCIVGTLLAYPLWFRGVSLLSPVSVSALGLLSPLTAIALGWGMLGEALGAREMVGVSFALISICSLQLSSLEKLKPVKPHALEEESRARMPVNPFRKTKSIS